MPLIIADLSMYITPSPDRCDNLDLNSVRKNLQVYLLVSQIHRHMPTHVGKLTSMKLALMMNSPAQDPIFHYQPSIAMVLHAAVPEPL